MKEIKKRRKKLGPRAQEFISTLRPLRGDIVIPRKQPAMFSTVINITTIRIYFHDHLFVMMLRNEFIGFSSWIAGGDKYCACFYMKTREIEVELDSRAKFEALLAEVDRSLGKE